MSGSSIRGTRFPQLTNLPVNPFASLNEEQQQQFLSDFRASIFRELRKLFSDSNALGDADTSLAADIAALQAAIAGISSVTPTVLEFTSSGSFQNTTSDPIMLYLTGTAAGGSGGGSATAGGNDGGGGGAGEWMRRWPFLLGAGDTLTITIPGDAAAPSAGDNDGNDGGNLVCTDGTFTLTLHGGKKGNKGSVKTGGLGGGWASTAVGQNATPQGPAVWSGASGSTGSTASTSGGAESFPGQISADTSNGGGSGGSSPWGAGGVGGVQNGNGNAPAADAWGAGGGGAGGGGSGSRAGALGRQGYLIIEYDAVS